MSSPLYEQFGYNLPSEYGELTTICNTTYVCGNDSMWHSKDSYTGEMGFGCKNQNALRQMCSTHESGAINCLKEGNVTYCYEKISNIPDSVRSSGQVAEIPTPGNGQFVCGFDATNDKHITVLASSCNDCPTNLQTYDGQRCQINQSHEEPAPVPVEITTDLPVTPAPEIVQVEEVVESLPTFEGSGEITSESFEDAFTPKDTVGVSDDYDQTPPSNNTSDTETKKSVFVCHFSNESYGGNLAAEKACKRDGDCSIDDNIILDKWVESIDVEMDKNEFTVQDVLNKTLPWSSDFRTSCVLGNKSKCEKAFTSINEVKEELKNSIDAKQFVKKLKKDRVYGAHVYNSIKKTNASCRFGKCAGEPKTVKDFVHISPNKDNEINIQQIEYDRKPHLFVNNVKLMSGKNLIHCSRDNSCSKYEDNIDTVINLDKMSGTYRPSKHETVFKIVKGEEVFILDNEYSVSANTKNEATKKCAEVLCMVNQENCPSDYCTTDTYNRCKPNNIDEFHTVQV